MRVDVVVNTKAGYADQSLIENQVRKVLFRCELHFHNPHSLPEMRSLIERVAKEGCEFLIVCGGDGTLNATLGPLLQVRKELGKAPSLCVIPSGTANDLASEMGISRHIGSAARAILEGGVKVIDILEIEAHGKTSYMVTNGGLGIPAQTARRANTLRFWVKRKAADPEVKGLTKLAFRMGKKAIELASSKIYEMLLVGDVTRWDSSKWEVEIEVPGKTSFVTKAPFIMINNQPSLGGKFKPAPFTSNADGTFNVMLIEPTSILPQVKTILDIRLGKVPELNSAPSFETSEVRLRAQDNSKLLTFFGDGEILQRNVRELHVRCIHPGLPIVVAPKEG